MFKELVSDLFTRITDEDSTCRYISYIINVKRMWAGLERCCSYTAPVVSVLGCIGTHGADNVNQCSAEQ